MVADTIFVRKLRPKWIHKIVSRSRPSWDPPSWARPPCLCQRSPSPHRTPSTVSSSTPFLWSNCRRQRPVKKTWFAPRGELGPRSEICPLYCSPLRSPSGVNTIYCLEKWCGKQRISPLGDKFTPRGQNSPLWDNFGPGGRQSLLLGVKLSMCLCSFILLNSRVILKTLKTLKTV
jgi:hypothetical protein